MRELFDLRNLLEPQAAARAARRQSPGLVMRLEELLGQMKDVVRQLSGLDPNVDVMALSRRYRACDRAFHETLLPESGNRRLCKIVNDIGILSLAIDVERIGPLQYPRQDGDSIRQHEEIVNAIRLGQPRQAFRAMRQHLRKAWRNVTAYVALLERQD
jgi:DNA-binding GntR family transcriptional regulator